MGQDKGLQPGARIGALALIQLTSALTDFKGPTIFICYKRIFVIANIERDSKYDDMYQDKGEKVHLF